ncbi:MAG: peptidoglycan recognition family protein [Planctomycetota bacterium]|jgi:N-acetyl-anhydromuramyl-L-alanine amidase AmpD|nr:peptidoglycan recognition family protein [Planctomycetota bacterium]
MLRPAISKINRSFWIPSLLLLISSFLSAQTKPTLDDTQLSQHHTVRNSRTINKVIIHTIEGSYRGAIRYFQMNRSRVSAHYCISEKGELTQCVLDKNIAWHAGNWSYNETSIGIEHEGYAGRSSTWTHDAMLRKSAELTRYLCLKYNIPMDRQHIIGHVEVPNQSHWDPGPHFPWNYYMTLVRQGSTATPVPTATNPTGPDVIETTASWLNVRTGIWGTRLSSIPRGSRFVRLESQRGWARINWRGRTAWLSEKYVRSVSGTTVHTVTTSKLNVRKGPSTRRSRIGHVRRGQKYVEIRPSGSWSKFWYSSVPGWFHGSYTHTENSR